MGITSRRKRPLDRTVQHLRDTRLVIIAAEGEKNEKQYFESELFGNRRVQVRVLHTTRGESAPEHVKERLRKFEQETDLQPDDQLWLVIDVDRWRGKKLSNVCSWAAQRRNRPLVQLAISNPCFDIWLYLHFADWNAGRVSSKQIQPMVRKYLGREYKSTLKISALKPGVDDAICRAESLDAKPEQRWPDNPGTHVYRLVRAIQSMGK